MLQADDIVVCALVEPEIYATLNRLRREGSLFQSNYERIVSALIADLQGFVIHPIDRATMQSARSLLERYPLRAADALHLATAGIIAVDAFVCSDQRLKQAAIGERLVVVDPCE